jgi:hypothetical protein
LNVIGWDWWIVAGGALQVIGVMALVIDIIATFNRLEGYRKRDRIVYAGSALEVGTAFPMGAVVGGREPTIDERVDRLETRLTELGDELRNTKARLKDWASETAAASAELVRKSSEQRFTAMEQALLGDTRWDKRRRVASVAAVVVGVTLATIGSVAP